MRDIQQFDLWMFKIQNKYYFDHERMSNAYTRILAYTNE